MKAGLFSIGLDTYWAQFNGLLDNLIGYLDKTCTRVFPPVPSLINTNYCAERRPNSINWVGGFGGGFIDSSEGWLVRSDNT